jgi:hypothetical protein
MSERIDRKKGTRKKIVRLCFDRFRRRTRPDLARIAIRPFDGPAASPPGLFSNHLVSLTPHERTHQRLQLSFMGLRLRVDRRAFRRGASRRRSQPCLSPPTRESSLFDSAPLHKDSHTVADQWKVADLIPPGGKGNNRRLVRGWFECSSGTRKLRWLGSLWAQSLAFVTWLRSMARGLGRATSLHRRQKCMHLPIFRLTGIRGAQDLVSRRC